MEKEIWKEIIGFEQLYKISNKGRVLSITTNEFLNPGLNSIGYYRTCLYKNKRRNYFNIHRLIALHFIDNPENKKEVNHINGIRSDNSLDNLEWCTHRENMQHAFRIGLNYVPPGKDHYTAKPVARYDLKGNFIAKYGYIREAARESGISACMITSHLKGRYKRAGNSIFKYI